MMDPEKKTSYPFNTYSFSSRHIFFNGFPFKEFLNDLTAVLKEMKNPNFFNYSDNYSPKNSEIHCFNKYFLKTNTVKN